MNRLRLFLVAATLMVALFTGSGIASAGVAWCDWGSPPPMDNGMVENPQNNPNGMPTPEFKNANGKFIENPLAGQEGGAPAGSVLPPGMDKAKK